MNIEQAGLLKLLKEIDSICRDNGITYYTTGGTAIGAIRHEGFIPWDDDIDVYMTRSNWEKFHDIMKETPPDQRVFECWNDNEEYNILIGRYVNTDSTQIYQTQLYSNVAKGQVIDVFILDPIIRDEEAISQYSKTVKLISDVLNEFYIYSKSEESCKDYSRLYAKSKKHGKRAVISKLIPELEKYSEEESDCYILRWGGLPHLFDKEMFAEPKYLKFEDMMIPLPTRLADHLIQLYGLDWMYLPPVRDRFDHGTITDPDRPYQELDSIIKSKVNRNLVTSKLAEHKARVLDKLPQIHHADRTVCITKGEFVKRRCWWYINHYGIDKSNLESIRPIIKDYVDLQTSSPFIGNNMPGRLYEKNHPVFVDIGDDLLETVLKLLITDRRIGKAERVLQARISQIARPMSQGLKDIQEMFQYLKVVQNLIEDGCLPEAEQMIDALIELTPNAELYKYKLYLMQKSGKGSSAEFDSFLSDCLSEWPDEADFYKFLGDYNQSRGEKNLAANNYRKFLAESKNGILLLDMKKNTKAIYWTAVSENDHGEEDPSQSDSSENRYFTLLKELIHICETHNIEYYVSGGILYYLNNETESVPSDFSSMDIVVDGYNASKLLKALRSLPDNRAVEHVGNNPKLRNLDILYMDTEATSIDFNKLDRRRRLRVSVPVRVARPSKDTFRQNSLTKLEKYWRIHCSYHFSPPKLKDSEKNQLDFEDKNVRSGSRLTKYLFKQNMKQRIGKKAQKIYIYDDNTLRKYPALQWHGRKKAEIQGASMYVPGDVDAYLRKRYGSRSNAIKKTTRITDTKFIDAEFEKNVYHDDALWAAILLIREQRLMNRYYLQEYKDDWQMAEEIFNELSQEL